MGNAFRSALSATSAVLQNNTVTAGTSNTIIQADSGNDGLDIAKVEPTPSTANASNNS